MSEHELKVTGMANPPHPGLTLRDDILPALGLSVEDAASKLDMTTAELTGVLNGWVAITWGLAQRIEALVGVENGGRAELWFNQQVAYDKWHALPENAPARMASDAEHRLFRAIRDVGVDLKTAPSYPVQIFIAGDVPTIERTCREFCMQYGLCVTVTPTNYIYTGGQEHGAVVGLINYARYPAAVMQNLVNTAKELGIVLMVAACQNSCSIQTPVETIYLSRRAETDRRLSAQRNQ